MVKVKEGVFKKTQLEKVEKGIVRLLPKEKNKAINAKDLKQILKDEGYGDIELPSLRDAIEDLTGTNYVNSFTDYKSGPKPQEKFYLTKYSGRRRRREEQGRGVVSTMENQYKRWFGSACILIGLGIFIYEGIGMTGAIVSSASKVTPSFIIGFVLFVLGAFILEVSFKKNSK